MTWYCEEYGKNILGVSYKLDDCKHCHLKDKCVRESIKENTELPFFLTFEEAFLVSEMFDSHSSEISSKMAKQTLYYASNSSSSTVTKEVES